MGSVAVDNGAARDRAPPKKRRRIVISCTECHRRKQKCDRELPCGNCTARGKQSVCAYEPGAPTATAEAAAAAASRRSDKHDSPSEHPSESPQRKNNEPLSTMTTSWGYSPTGPSTLGFLKRIEAADDSNGEDEATPITPSEPIQDTMAIREKYKSLIRQLPGKVYTDKLIHIFMNKFNYQYYAVDPVLFYKQLEQWNALPFSLLSSSGPQALPPDLRVFPAVLFGVVAIGLLALPEDDPAFESLKYARNMTFEDLAIDYSDASEAIVNLFGKKNLNVSTVLAHFLRAHFLKYIARVTESWHMISVATREAQELGMHRDSLDPKPEDSSIESILENQWQIQRRRNLYSVLMIWDINMAVCLGRPQMESRHSPPTPPMDAPIPKDTSQTPVMPRDDEKEPLTPITRNLYWLKMIKPLRDIQDLEQEGSYPKDFAKVDRIHQAFMELEANMPPALRDQNPDTRWDGRPDTLWLREARSGLRQCHYFGLMALHRPYIFSRKQSRLEAIRASLGMLEVQKRDFEASEPISWRNFMNFFGSFDAIVLITSIYIVFPYEHPEFKNIALQHFHAAVERFSAMQQRNPLARSAQGVLKAILVKFTKAINNNNNNNTAPPSTVGAEGSATPASLHGTAVSTPASYMSKAPSDGTCSSSSVAILGGTASSVASTSLSDWPSPADGIAGLATMYPTSDLIYNDLTAVQDGAFVSNPVADESAPMDPAVVDWQFGGDFGEDTFWQFLNQYQPGVVG